MSHVVVDNPHGLEQQVRAFNFFMWLFCVKKKYLGVFFPSGTCTFDRKIAPLAKSLALSLAGRWNGGDVALGRRLWWRSLVLNCTRQLYVLLFMLLKPVFFCNCLNMYVTNDGHFFYKRHLNRLKMRTSANVSLGVMVNFARVWSVVFLTRSRSAILEMTRPAILLSVMLRWKRRMLPFCGYFTSNDRVLLKIKREKKKSQLDFCVESSSGYTLYLRGIVRLRLRNSSNVLVLKKAQHCWNKVNPS